MNKEEADKLVDKIFTQKYDATKFVTLSVELLQGYQKINRSILIQEEGVKKVVLLGQDKELNLDVYAVELSNYNKIKRARSWQRNFIVKLLEVRNQDKALVAFYSAKKEEVEWRFSFIKIDLELKEGRLSKELSPAKRYSFIVGSKNTRTARQRISNFLLSKDKGIALLEEAFKVEAINKEFYQKIFAWYERALKQVIFPNDENINQHSKTSLTRLLTRLIFVWFIKEKKLINPDLFNEQKLKEIIYWNKLSSFYKAILQNLFFATLNREIKDRSFRTKTGSNNYGVTNIYRYRTFFQNPDEEQIKKLFEQTPFLNGGLFECLDREASPEEVKTYDKTIRQEKNMIRIDGFSDKPENKINLPNELFFCEDEQNLGLINLLGQYQFTVEESTPVDIDVALDPELLGKIFENLLATQNPETEKQARKETGSFYTPRPIVDYMVSESLKAYLLEKVTPQDNDKTFFKERLDYLFFATTYAQENKNNDGKELIYKKEIPKLIEAISQIKIFDPAVGSGAFPMGLLQKIVSLLETLDPENNYLKNQQLKVINQLSDEESKQASKKEIEQVFSENNRYNSYGRKLHLIKKCLYGVDKQSIALQICKLRFFISLVVEQEPNEDLDKNYGIKALPNLETKFIATDSLLKLNIEHLKDDFFFTQKIEPLEKELKEIRHQHFIAKTPKTKKKIRKRDIKKRKEIKNVLVEMKYPIEEAEKLASWDPYSQTQVADWFDPQWQFGVKNGFDIIIGNPPYIQLQNEQGKLANLYKNCNYKSFARSGDIYSLFYEKANQLLNDTGHLAFITSNKWMRAGYGEKLRGYLAENTTPKILLDLGPGIFESATVDTNILLFKKGTSKEVNCTAYTLKEKLSENSQALETTVQNNSTTLHKFSSDSWVILSPIEQQIKEKIEKVGTPLKDWDITINRGILTGYNEAFIIDEKTKKELIDKDPKSEEIIRPILRGKDIKRYHAQFADKWLIATHNGYDDESKFLERIKIEEYPAVKKFLDIHQEKVYNRYDKGDTPYNLRSCKYWSDFFKPKIVYPCIMAESAKFYYDDNQFFAPAPANIITGKDIKFLVGILNSNLTYFLFKRFYMGGGIENELKTNNLLRLPVSKTAKNKKEIIELANKVLKITSNKNYPNEPLAAEKTIFEKEIDKEVYKLYQLSKEEIKFIEKN